MNTTTKALQYKQQPTHQEQINYKTVSQTRSCSTYKNAMEQIRFEQKLLGKELVSAIRSTGQSAHQSIDNNNATLIDVAGPTSVDRQPEFGRRAYDLYGNMEFYLEEKDEYGVYRDDQRYARDLDGNTIRLHNTDIRQLLERASRDEPSYICLPEHSNLFTKTKLVPEIYTKDEINEMFYGVYGEHEKNKEAFQMKHDGVYYPLNDSISWLTTCMEEMKQDIARIQHATDVARPPSIDRRRPPSIDNRQPPSIDRHHRTSIDNPMPASINDSPPRPHTMKSQKDFHTREEIDQLMEGIYRALETTEERLDGRCDDINFPTDLSISALTSKIEAIQRELVEIQSYIARRPEASSSIDRRNNISTDIHHRTSIDDTTNRGQLVPKMTSDMSDTHYHGEEISADTYATLRRHQFNLESLEERLQRMENTTATMKEKWRRGDEATRDFTGLGMHGIGLFKQVWKEPKLTSNTKLDTTACLRAWYAWDWIIQTSLEGPDTCLKVLASCDRYPQGKACTLFMLRNEIRSVLEISDDFGAFWRYLEQAPEMTIELDHRSILERNNRSILTSVYRSTAKRAESPFGHSRLEAQVLHPVIDTPKIRSVLEISDDFGAFWRYLEQAPEMTIELDHRSILERNNRSILTSAYRSTAKRAESPFGHSRLEAQVFTILQDYS
ncbi:hypothetical protein DY000_02021616 [Brassica cretica]|uniref:Uncharacterized protein n=1 Tax=Brassica cretica TaxID=69181 RepID=A0ABQ7EEE0_BRACR|nr:hypothetical protein DY000_02021616 [Brassica cretica]